MNDREAEFLEIPELVTTKIYVRGLFRKRKFRRAVRSKGPLRFYSKHLGREIVVPEGFLSDGASIPQLFWNIWNPFGQYLESAIIHDYFCKLGHTWESPINFVDAAKVFGEAMLVQGVNKYQVKVMVAAVIAFGPKFAAQDQ